MNLPDPEDIRFDNDGDEGGKTVEIFILDTETTDKDTKSCRIVDIAVLNLIRQEIWQKLVKPTNELGEYVSSTEEAERKHGYKKSDLENEDKWDTVCQELLGFIGSSSDITLIIAHNSPFDERVIRNEFKRVQRKVPSSWIFADSIPFGTNLV